MCKKSILERLRKCCNEEEENKGIKGINGIIPRKKIEGMVENRVSDFMLSENLACEVVCAETNSVFAEEI